MSKKLERILRLISSSESKTRSDSEDRQEKIKALWQELKKFPDAAVKLAQDEFGETLLELVVLQKDEIEYLRRSYKFLQRIAKRRLPSELAKLFAVNSLPEASVVLPAQPELSPKQKQEAKRRRKWADGGAGLIELEFGGALQAWWRNQPLLCNPFYTTPVPPPTCLDDILTGGRVKMERLELLFWMHRNRFGKLRPFTRGRGKLYDYRAVLRIMDRFLSEESKTRGRPLRTWLSDADIRTRVLRGIEERINSFSMPEQIKAKFLALVRRHLPDSAKK